MKHTKNLTLSVLAALGIGLAGPGIAGSGYGHSASSAMSSSAETSSDASSFSARSFDGSSHSFDSSDASMMSESSSAAYSDSGSLILSGDATASDQSLYVLVDEPSLVFSDGIWYSYVDGDWYALDDSGAWYSIADAGDYSDYSYYDGSDAYASYDGSAAFPVPYSDGTDTSLQTSDAYAFDGSEYDVMADASDSDWYYVAEAPHDEVVLYSTDGIAWYSMDDELVAVAPIEATEDPTISGPVAFDDSGTVTYYYFL
jgi:hypothetical protein